MRILILGGTSEANALAARMAESPGVDATLSLAGRTQNPRLPPIACRIGGFGGVEGLAAYLSRERVDAVVDATHPFADRMSRHAEAACAGMRVPLAVLGRPPWISQAGDRWIEVGDADAAATALGDAPRRVFLTVGRLSVDAFAAAPQHHYIVRAVDPLDGRHRLASCRLIAARGPFDVAAEIALVREERVDILVSKNSGGAATYPKIVAARRLGLPVVMIRRPPRGAIVPLASVDAVLAWLGAHGGAMP